MNNRDCPEQKNNLAANTCFNRLFFIILAVFLLCIMSVSAATNVTILYGWNGTEFVPVQVDANGALKTTLNLSQSTGLSPKSDNSYDIGSAGLRWRTGYIINLVSAGSINVGGSLNATSINITGSAYFATSSGNAGIGTTKPDNLLTIRGSDADSYLDVPGILHLNVTDSQNTTLTNIITLDHLLNNPLNTTNPKAGVRGGIGLGILFRAINNESEIINVSFINATLADAANASEAGALTFYTLNRNGVESRLVQRLVLNGTDVFVSPAGGNTYINPTGGRVGIGTTGPQNALDVVGAVTVSKGLNASNLNVTGFSITDDSLVTLSDGSKKKIKDVKAGEEVLTLDEKTGKLVPRKVNALLDHGIKPIYEMATESGKAINTTAEHPYFMRTHQSASEKLSSLTTHVLPAISPESFLKNFKTGGSSLENVGGCMRKTTIRGNFDGGNNEVFKKSLSLDNIALDSLHANEYSFEFLMPFSAYLISMPLSERDLINLASTSSSEKNLNFNIDESFTSEPFSCIVQGSLDMPLSQGRVSLKDLLETLSSFQHFQNGMDRNPSPFESGLSMADFAVSHNKLINFGSHNVDNDNSIYKTFGENQDDQTILGKWLEVRYLQEGMEIAVPDYEKGAIKWEKIASIKQLEPQHVYDLSIEGTRNFIANDIITHNTYLATSSGNVGIGTTAPGSAKLNVTGGNISISGTGTGIVFDDGSFNKGDISARVYNDVALSIPNNLATTINFSQERFDTDAISNLATNNSRLTAKTAGKYLIGGNIRFADAGATVSVRELVIRLNGVTTIFDVNQPSNANYVMNLQAVTLYNLAVNDYVELTTYQNSGGSLTLDTTAQNSPEFWMVKVG